MTPHEIAALLVLAGLLTLAYLVGVGMERDRSASLEEAIRDALALSAAPRPLTDVEYTRRLAALQQFREASAQCRRPMRGGQIVVVTQRPTTQTSIPKAPPR